MQKTYLVEEIFQDIPDDPNNVIMNIPPEICEESDIKPGDNLHIEVQDGKMIITKV
jgi:hypothetical protein